MGIIKRIDILEMHLIKSVTVNKLIRRDHGVPKAILFGIAKRRETGIIWESGKKTFLQKIHETQAPEPVAEIGHD